MSDFRPGRSGFTLCAIVISCLAAVPFCWSESTVTASGRNDRLLKPKSITLPHSIDYPPLIYVDENGETQGMLADYWRLWSKKIGIGIQFEPLPWHICIDRVRAGQSDLIPGMFYSADRDADFDFSQSFMEIKTTLFTRTSSGLTHLDELEGRRVGATRGDRVEDFLRRSGRKMDLQIYEGFENVIKAAGKGEIDAFGMDYPIAASLLDKHGLSDDFSSHQTLYVGNFCGAVKEGNQDLLIYINEGIEQIEEEELADILNRWAPARRALSPRAIRFLLIICVAVAAALALIHNTVLRAQVRRRTAMLEKAERKYRRLIEDAYEGIAVSREGKFVFVSPGMVRLTGFSAEDLAGRDRCSFVHPDDRHLLESRIADVASKRSVSTSYQVRIITRDGGTKWLQVSTTNIEWEDEPAELEFLVDITDLKKAQKTLARADAHLRAIVNVSPVPIIVSRFEDGKIMYVNNNLGDLIGYRKEELIGKLTPDFYYDIEDRKKVLAILNREGKIDNFEVRLKKRDGTVFWSLFSLVITAVGKRKVIIGSLYDISKIKEVEDKLRLYRELFLNSEDGIVLLDPDGNYIESNPAHQRRSGYTFEELRERGVDGLIGPKSGNIFRDGMASGRSLRREVSTTLKDGRVMAVDIAAFPIRNAKGEITSFAGIGRDITEHKQALKDIETANRELRETQAQLVQSAKMASLGQFVAGIAHEINTPVGAISSMHDTLIRGIEKLKRIIAPLSESSDAESRKLRSILKIIEDANRVIETGTERVATIVKRLRSFARLDEAELKTVDIHEGLEDTLILIHHEIKHHITVKKDYGDLPPIACYPGVLNQVFLNILNNARHAIAGKGVVSIKTYMEGDTANIAISDDGEGISPGNLKKIFDPGFTTKGVGVGTGLGLSICFQIMKDHHGTINVESEIGKGTTFTIVLPTNLGEIIAAGTPS